MCDKYLLSYYRENIVDILNNPDANKHFSVNISFVDLSGNDQNLVNSFAKDPEKSLKEWDKAIEKVQTELILESEMNYVFKNHTHCRIHSLPLYPEFHRSEFPQNDDTNKFLQVSGTVIRMTAVKMLEYQRQYTCTKCKYTMMVTAEFELKNIITPPKKCGNPEECKSTNIINIGELNAEFCKDYQEIKMQETVSKLDVGSMPSCMWVTLEDDLVDSCKPGDIITVCGFVKRRQNQFNIGKRIEIELVMRANHIQVNNNNCSNVSITSEVKDMFESFWKTYSDTPLAARDIILKSICPQLFGLYIVKLAMAVVLAGGSNRHNNTNTGVRVRAEPHLLLVGDPGTGKSQLLRFASKIIPRSVLTTGVGSTAAGLTVTAILENGEWQLEGGALVMSDSGICCIDEFNTMKEHDRTSIHEAMEQQTISVAKAGIVCKLSTRCSILAATNPKGNLDLLQPLNMNVALASPLLSRFDLILLMRDTIDNVWDSQLVDYIFASFDTCNSSKLINNINWSIETLQAYFAVIKKIHPVLGEDSNKILSTYYQAQRRKNFRNKARTTVRLLDSLVRLSQGHARLMFHEEVEIVDAVTAVILVETAMETDSSVFNLHFNLRNDFPQDPNINYKELITIVLKKLELGDLLEKELATLQHGKLNRPGPSNIRKPSSALNTESKFFQVQSEDSNSGPGTKREKQTKKQCSKLLSSESSKTSDVSNFTGDSKNQMEKNRTIAFEKNNHETNKVGKILEERETDDLSRPLGKRTRIMDSLSPKKIKLNKNDLNKNIGGNYASGFSKQIKRITEPNFLNHQNFENDSHSTNNTDETKKIKINIFPNKNEVKENYIKDDLKALECPANVNDIFQMDDLDSNENEGFGLNVEDNGAENLCKSKKNAQKNVTNFQNIDSRNIEKSVKNDVSKNKNSEELSQQTRTKNMLSRFRFKPKETKQHDNVAEAKVTFFENNDSFDISVVNSTSTQKEKSVEDHFKPGKNVPTKKFNFKKVRSSDTRGSNTLQNENVATKFAHSIFEEQGDINDFDLDI